MDKITGVLDALQSVFGKGFLLAGFLPVTTYATVSWMLGCWLSPECRDLTDYLLRAKALQEFAIGVVALLLVSMSSFVFWLLNPAFRQILEGRAFFSKFQDWLAEGHRKILQDLTNKLQERLNEKGLYRKAKATWPQELSDASTGTGSTIQDRSLPDNYVSLKQSLESLQPVDFNRLSGFYQKLVTELKLTSITHVQLLRNMRDDLMNSLLPAGEESAERAYNRLLRDRTFRYPERAMNVGPTVLTNLQEAERDYLASCYGIDVALFWADIQSVATRDEKFAPVLENAKTRYDFSVAMTAMSALFTLGWIVLHIARGSGLFGSDSLVYVAVVVIGAATTVLFHRLVLISYAGFSDTVRSAVELYRFKLMKDLHLEYPKTDIEEQTIWRGLAERLEVGVRKPITYDHTP